MGPSFYQILFFLLAGISLIVLLSVKYKVHPFFSLLLASLVVGLGVEFSFLEVIGYLKEGFGNIMKSLGMIIVLGTTLGVLLEQNGSTKLMADTILKWIGNKYPALAMSLTGFVVGLPIFCDSGFIVLSGLNLSISRRSGTPVIIMAVSMATGLYAAHCLVPPHPGIVAAATVLGIDIGKLMLFGMIAAVPAMLVGYAYAYFAGKHVPVSEFYTEEIIAENSIKQSAVLMSFLPVLMPVLLIALRSFFILTEKSMPFWKQAIATLGDPVAALSIGVVIALLNCRPLSRKTVNNSLQEAAAKAGGILVIIAAGGAFGAVLSATNIGKQVSETLPLEKLGILFPFLLTVFLKTAQGSSTVAIITASYIVQPLLPALHFLTPESNLFCVLAMGAGSMMISHANDAYFWVIARFEKLEIIPMLKVYSIATILMSCTSFAMIYLLYKLF